MGSKTCRRKGLVGIPSDSFKRVGLVVGGEDNGVEFVGKAKEVEGV